MSTHQDTPSHPSAQVERAWARFRNGPGGALLRDALNLRTSYLTSIGLPRLPPEVTLPGAIPWNLLALAEAQARGEEIGRTVSTEGTILAQSVACWAAYREAKTLYRVEPVLAEALARTPWPAQVPTRALRLPSRCPVLLLPWEGQTIAVAAYYDVLTGHEATGQLELRLVHLDGEHWWTLSLLHLSETDLGACALAAGLEVVARSGSAEATDAFTHPLAGLALTVLLYLAGEPDLVRQVHPGAKPARDARMQRRDADRWKDLRAPAVFALGRAYRAAIERWEREQDQAPGEPTGRTVRPHVRRAHAHLYWTGPGRQTPRVRFLLPIPVKGAPLPEEAERPSVTPVR